MEIQIVKAGWLHRQSSVLKRWKKQWFVLHRTGELMYFDSQESHSPEETLLIRAVCINIKAGDRCDFNPPENKTKASLLHIQLRQDDLRLCAESPDDMRAWQIALEEARVLPNSGNAVPPFVQSGVMNQSGYVIQQGTQPGVVVSPGAQVMYQQQIPSYTGQVIAPPGHYVVRNAATGNQTVIMGNQPGQVVCVREPYYRRNDVYPFLAGAAVGSMMWGPYMYW